MRVTRENLQQILAHLSGRPEIALDSETSGLEETDKPFAVIIADEQSEYYFDERTCPGYQEELALFLRTPRVQTIVTQNCKFDWAMLLRIGCTLAHRQVIDLAFVARILRNDHMKYSLDAQASRAGMRPKEDIKSYIKEHNLYEERTTRLGVKYRSPRYDWVPVDLMESYACHDARLTYDLWQIYKHQLDDQDKEMVARESLLTPVCFGMERRGVLVSEEYTRAALKAEETLVKDLQREFLMTTGVHFVDSAKVLCPVFEKQGEIVARTEKGNLSLTDDVLEAYTTPAARLVQTIRHHEKRISTYYRPYLEKADANWRLHPWMWQAGTRTGRFSYSDPNLQNIPKEEGSVAPFVVRGCIVPTPGTKFFSLDYKQQEYRMSLAYANETRMIDAVMGGADVHQATASLLGITRSQAKTLNFAILYGAGVDKIAAMLGCDKQTARMLKTRYFLGLPKVERLINEIISVGRSRGFVRNWAGRKLYSDFEHCYALPNHLIQSGGADVVKTAMVRIASKYGTDAPMVLQVHDQLVFELTPEQEKHIPGIKEIMESIWEMNGMRLLVDVVCSDKSLAERDMVPYEP